MFDWTRFLIIIIAVVIHHFLSNRASVYWGAIIPSIYLISCGWLLYTAHQINHPLQTTLLILFGLVILLVKWGAGRDSYKKHREGKLQKMKIHDI